MNEPTAYTSFMSASFCSRCGSALAPNSAFCPRCGASTSGQPPAPPHAPYAQPSPAMGPPPIFVATAAPPPQSHTGRNIAIIIIVLLVIVVVLFAVPIPHSFSTTVTTEALIPGTSTVSFPAGAAVSGSFSTGDGGSVTFVIDDASGNLVYSADSSSGSFAFSASDPPYTFGAEALLSETVSVTGTASFPIL